MARSKNKLSKSERAERDRRRRELENQRRLAQEERDKQIEEEIRQSQRAVVHSSAAFSANFSTQTFDIDSGQPLERFSKSVNAVISDYVDTTKPVRETQLYNKNANQTYHNLRPGDCVLLAGQVSSPDIEEWQSKKYPVGSRVVYNGETYFAASTETGTEPPVKVHVRPNNPFYYEREENSDWALIGKENSLASPGRRVSNPDFGFIDGAWQTGTQGAAWLVTATPNESKIFFWDADLSDVLAPNSTYVLEHVENVPSYVSGEKLPSNIRLFPPGTTFSTGPDVTNVGEFTTSQPCIAPRSLKTASGYSSSVLISLIYVNTVPFFSAGQSIGGNNGIYQYQGPDSHLLRLNAGDGPSGAPFSYKFLIVNEYDPDVPPGEPVINRPWISDDKGSWYRAKPGIFIGKSYGSTDIPEVGWRGRDSFVGVTPAEWRPNVTYYPNDRVKFKDLEYAFRISSQSGLANVSPLESDFWEIHEHTGVTISGSVRGYKINVVTVDNFEMPIRMFGLVAPEKSVKISSRPLEIGNISFEIDGQYGLDYAISFSSSSTYSTRIYNTSYPVRFSLNPAGLEVLKVRWDFGDGTTAESSDLTVSHLYNTGSLSAVQLRVSVKVTEVSGRVYRTSRNINLRKTDAGAVALPIVVG